MTVAKDQVFDAVSSALVDALGVDEDEVVGSATLLGDLEAESIDLLDILFRLERSLGVKIAASDLAEHVQGGISEEEFGTPEGVVSDVGLAQLARVMPQIDVEKLRGSLPAEDVMGLFTVDNLVSLVEARVGAAAAA
ncbi:acyl carrier protein [Haloactinopolyspora alba]|uniref:Acyl carrier protein n=1 Tax=Haloactinopolyspora alba TaxID=648780 RepID=A0A2P8DYV5_9ACTN|nr:phosphopantetheine-binding protein [Haloactinopolyspora alba]PSL02357.1 acyl carrier protein [Haloactinopolyspora alba]